MQEVLNYIFGSREIQNQFNSGPWGEFSYFSSNICLFQYFTVQKKIHLFEATSILNNAKLNLNIFFKKSLLSLIMYVCFVSTWVENTLSFKNKYICLSRLVRNLFLQEKHSRYSVELKQKLLLFLLKQHSCCSQVILIIDSYLLCLPCSCNCL